MNKYVLFAPHVDDEMIGCWRLLEGKQISQVYYFYDVTEIREKEARLAGLTYCFEPVFDEFDFSKVPNDVTILAPNIRDSHPDHKMVNHLAKKLPNRKKYYSIDMNVRREVLISPTVKLATLLKTYPSQASLFKSNAKYHLFESLLSDDSSKMIWVTFQKEGIHNYPEAATDPKLLDVSFLAHPHRHIFKFKVSIEVFSNNRDIEFIQFKRWLESLYSSMEIHYKSCEMLSDELYLQIMKKYPNRSVKIEISEDGENGSSVEYML